VRRFTVTADPAACRLGLAMLVELARAGRDDLDGAIAVLRAIVDADSRPTRDRATMPVHGLRDPEDYAGVAGLTICGLSVCGRLYRDHSSDSFEAETALGIVNVTLTMESVTCKRCKKGKRR
jgi:hypothetical protein